MVIVRPGTPDPNELVSDTLHFNYPGPDTIILRSCDSHDFRVPKLYIVICSPVLGNLIQSVLNTSDVPKGEELEPLPMVKLPESKETLHSLLTFIFPVTPILPSTTDKIMGLLAVAQKYQMDSVLSHIRGAISRQDPPFLRLETAFHVYFFAQHHELHREAVKAARVSLRSPMTIEGLDDKLEFAGMTGAYLHELWKYREQVRTDLKPAVLEFRNSGLPDDGVDLHCTTPRSSYHSFPQWLDDFIESIADAPHLFDLIEFENARARHIKDETYYSETCSCADISSQVIRTFWEALTAVVHGTIHNVHMTDVIRLYRETNTNANRQIRLWHS